MIQNEFHVDVVRTKKVEVSKKNFTINDAPHLGCYDEFRVADYHCPESWSKDGIFIAVKEGESLWFDLRPNWDCVCIPAMEKVNPVTNEPADLKKGLFKEPKQNYLRLPEQKWIDGYNNEGIAYQFTITKKGLSYGVAENILPVEMQDSQSIGFAFFAAKNPKAKPEKPTKTTEKQVLLMGLSQVFSQPYPPVLYNSPPPTEWKGIGSQPIGSYPVWCDVEQPSKAPTKLSLRRSKGVAAAGLESLRGMSFNASAPHMNDTISCDASGGNVNYDMAISCNEVAEEKTAGMPMMAESVDMGESLDVDDPTLDKATMGAGGRIIQEIYQDHNTVDYYHDKPDAILVVYFALPDQFERIMKKGRRQEPHEDKYVHSGKIGGKQIPLIK